MLLTFWRQHTNCFIQETIPRGQFWHKREAAIVHLSRKLECIKNLLLFDPPGRCWGWSTAAGLPWLRWWAPPRTRSQSASCCPAGRLVSAHSTSRLSLTFLIRLEVVCEWVPASVLRVSVCSCSVHSGGRDLDCSRASTTLLMLETRWRNHPELQNALLLTFT